MNGTSLSVKCGSLLLTVTAGHGLISRTECASLHTLVVSKLFHKLLRITTVEG